jgi:hypothetical protein
MNVEVLPSCTPRIFSPLIGCPLPAHPRDDPHGPHGARKTLEAFSSTLRDTDLDALSDDLVGVVRETMQPAHVSCGCAPMQFRRGASTLAAGGPTTTRTCFWDVGRRHL